MRRVLVIFLLVALCLQHGLRLGVLAWWKINQERIARTLCENRDKPQLKCCGRCVLIKKLNKADGSDKAPLRNANERFAKEEPAILAAACTLPPVLQMPVAVVHHLPGIPSLLVGVDKTQLQPPQV